MDSTVMMALGDYRFSLSTAAYQELERENSWRWPELERIGSAPALQFVGAGCETVSMRGVIYPQFRGGLAQLDAMRAAAGQGEKLHMVDGTGRVWGDYVIERVRETQEVFVANGLPRRITFDLTLKSYGG